MAFTKKHNFSIQNLMSRAKSKLVPGGDQRAVILYTGVNLYFSIERWCCTLLTRSTETHYSIRERTAPLNVTSLLGQHTKKKCTYPQLSVLQFIQEKRDWHALNSSDRNRIVVQHVSTCAVLLLVNIRAKANSWVQWLVYEESVYFVSVCVVCM